MREIRVAVVGAGILGRRHARVFNEQEGASTVAVVDVDLARARAVAEACGARSLAGLDELWRSPDDVDALAVATPDHLHCEPVLSAIAHGKHVLVEKPLATTREDMRAIADAAAEASVVVMVNYSQRFVPEYAAIKSLVDDGAVGTPAMVTTHKFDTVHVPTRMIGWAAATSPIFFMSSHDLDLVRWYLGRDPVEVIARERRGVLAGQGVDTHDGVNALIAFDGGVMVNLHASWIHPNSYPVVADGFLQIIGSDGMLTLHNRTRRLELFNRRGGVEQVFSGPHTADEVDGRIVGAFTDAAAHFLGCIRDGREPDTSVQKSLPVTEAQIAVVESLRTGMPVSLRS